ncbi:hypothetical protein L3Q82_016947 [Scortum barcoo]|uniref:Uncharacterized protein n=1 Tax=Scortum barcoo TaxID=214431 RepID=A0ACB8X8X5_9TELE|nr:hypothetical protein L3Q82_016947 [Scortum barcoo]
METAAATGASECAEEKMEKEAAPGKRRHSRTTALNIISSLCSVASVAFCVLLSINAADTRSRVAGLESGEHTLIRAPGYSLDDLNSLIEQRVDELLSQRSYENLARIRTARQASPECNCPPGDAPLSELGGKSSTKDGSQTLRPICWLPSDTELKVPVILPLKSPL